MDLNKKLNDGLKGLGLPGGNAPMSGMRAAPAASKPSAPSQPQAAQVAPKFDTSKCVREGGVHVQGDPCT